MPLELITNANVELRQTLNPLLLQKLDILQADTQILSQEIHQALAQNVMLELVHEPDAVENEAEFHLNDVEISEDAKARLAEYDENSIDAITSKGEADSAFENYAPDLFHRNSDAEAEERRRHFFESNQGEQEAFRDFLQEIDLEAAKDAALASQARDIAGYLTDDGFLAESDEQLAQSLNLPVEEVARTVAFLQSLEPAGIAAHDLRESLLIQLKRQKLEGSIAWDVVERHLDELERNQLPRIAQELEVEVSDVQEAVKVLRSLNFHPGGDMFRHVAPVIKPDVDVFRDKDGVWKVKVNKGMVPEIALNETYLEMAQNPKASSEERKYLREKTQEARMFLDSIEQRWTTLERISVEILHRQMDFFEHGDEALKPMTLADLAGTLSLNESTISRGISKKYMRTPWGVRDFKFFFRSGYESKNGESISSLTVTEKIKRMIAEENSAKPLSDQAISDKLKEMGLDVARRTVAKYRESVGILPASGRKVH